MSNSLDTTINDLLANAPPRSKSLIVSLLGDMILPHGEKLWIGTLIELLEPFGINNRSVRTSVQRLSQDGWLSAKRHGRRSRYRLTKSGVARIKQASPRMYSPALESWDERWTVAFAPPGSLQGWQRAELRQDLEWEGYSMAASGLFIHPLGDPENLHEILDEIKIQDKVFVFVAESAAQTGILNLRDGVSEFWDLDVARDHYKSYIKIFERWRDFVGSNGSATLSAMQCFQLRLLTIHNFRRASLHAPRLPAALFPENWAGVRAYEICRDIYKSVWEGAEQHLEAVYTRSDEPPPRLHEYFYQRFGGLQAGSIEAAAQADSARAPGKATVGPGYESRSG